VLQLAEGDDQRRGTGVAGEHRVADEVDQEAGAGQAEHNADEPREQGQDERELPVRLAALRGQVPDARNDKQRGDRRRPYT
jgi:hypothetical protein